MHRFILSFSQSVFLHMLPVCWYFSNARILREIKREQEHYLLRFICSMVRLRSDIEWYDDSPARVCREVRWVLTGTGVHTNFRSPSGSAGALSQCTSSSSARLQTKHVLYSSVWTKETATTCISHESVRRKVKLYLLKYSGRLVDQFKFLILRNFSSSSELFSAS